MAFVADVDAPKVLVNANGKKKYYGDAEFNPMRRKMAVPLD